MRALFKSKVESSAEKKKPEEIIEDFHNLVEVGYVTVEEKVFRKMSKEELREFIASIKDKLLS